MSNKRTWMKIHTGILDPKHRETMGVRVWLFMYLIDHANWETGIVEGFTDGKAAEALQMPKSTLRHWRLDLQEAGYITSEPGFQCQNITIHKWRNPREVQPEALNVNTPDMGCLNSDTSTSGSVHSSIKSDTHHRRKSDTLTLDSHKDHTIARANAEPPTLPAQGAPTNAMLEQDMLHMAHVEAIARGPYRYKRMTDTAAEKGQAVLDELYALVDTLPSVELWADFVARYEAACPGYSLPSKPDVVATWAAKLLCDVGKRDFVYDNGMTQAEVDAAAAALLAEPDAAAAAVFADLLGETA